MFTGTVGEYSSFSASSVVGAASSSNSGMSKTHRSFESMIDSFGASCRKNRRLLLSKHMICRYCKSITLDMYFIYQSYACTFQKTSWLMAPSGAYTDCTMNLCLFRSCGSYSNGCSITCGQDEILRELRIVDFRSLGTTKSREQ